MSSCRGRGRGVGVGGGMGREEIMTRLLIDWHDSHTQTGETSVIVVLIVGSVS